MDLMKKEIFYSEKGKQISQEFVSFLIFTFKIGKISLWLSSTIRQLKGFWKLLENLQGTLCDADNF